MQPKPIIIEKLNSWHPIMWRQFANRLSVIINNNNVKRTKTQGHIPPYCFVYTRIGYCVETEDFRIQISRSASLSTARPFYRLYFHQNGTLKNLPMQYNVDGCDSKNKTVEKIYNCMSKKYFAQQENNVR